MFNPFKIFTKQKEEKLGYPVGPVLGQKGFVNEHASKKDIKKYKLKEIRPVEDWKLKEGYFFYHFTIDRERDIWFLYKKSEESGLDTDPRDREYYTGNKMFVLHYKGENIEVILRRMYDEDSALNQNRLEGEPYTITWDLIRINKPESLKDTPDEEIIKVLKEALSVYGTEKIHTSVPQKDIVVKFKF